jgi:hypothetical protein
MTIEKITTKSLKDSKNLPINEGDIILFNNGDRDIIGKFNGITKRNTLEFVGPLSNKTFRVNPKNISDALHISFKFKLEDVENE